MSESDIEEIMAFVRQTARSRFQWMDSLREPTDDEVSKAQLFCEMYPTKEQQIDREDTVVLVTP